MIVDISGFQTKGGRHEKAGNERREREKKERDERVCAKR